MNYVFTVDQPPTGNVGLELPGLRALPCGTPDNAYFWVSNGDLTLLYRTRTGADAESLPGIVRSDNHAVCQLLFDLKAAHINGFPAEFNFDTERFHLTQALVT